MHKAFRISILGFILMSYLFLNSCGSSSSKDLPEGNIDVDSDIYIVPIGNVEEKHLAPLVPMLEKRFTTKVHIAMDKKMPDPDYAYDFEAKKHIAMYILTEMMKLDIPNGAKILGVANVDLFVHRSVDEFIFGQAQFGRTSKAALISMYRMNPFSYVGGKANDKLLAERMIKEAIHELGHVFGMRNCPEPECVMSLPKGIKDLDRKTNNFCINCQKAFRNLVPFEKVDEKSE